MLNSGIMKVCCISHSSSQHPSPRFDEPKVKIEVESLEYSMFQLIGEGFKAHESMNFISTSYDEIIHSQIKADGKGNIPTIRLQPAVIGKSGGVCHIDILRDEGSIHMKFPWGTETVKGD